MRALTFRERLREEKAKSAAAELADPWRVRLERVRGKVDFFDRLERISSQTLLDLLEVPQRSRTAGTFRRLAKVMAELGWTAVRVRGLTRGGYLEQVRGYCREPTILDQPSSPSRRAAVMPSAPQLLCRARVAHEIAPLSSKPQKPYISAGVASKAPPHPLGTLAGKSPHLHHGAFGTRYLRQCPSSEVKPKSFGDPARTAVDPSATSAVRRFLRRK